MKKLSIMLALLIAAARLGELDDNWDMIVQHEVSLDMWNLVHPQVVEAGHPACDPNQPKRPPCDMKSCAQMGKDGKPTGAKCSSYCAKGCCGCGTACTVDFPGSGPNPDEGEPQLRVRILVLHPPE